MAASFIYFPFFVTLVSLWLKIFFPRIPQIGADDRKGARAKRVEVNALQLFISFVFICAYSRLK